MARARNIKPGFFKNEFLAEMDAGTRLLFIGLWTLADREGRLEDRPKRIKMELLPYDDINVDENIDRLQHDKFLIRYEVAGKKYIQIENFTKHQNPHHKEVASEIPAPAGFAQVTKHAYEVSNETREAIIKRDGGKCLCCGTQSSLSIDHIKPLASGGDNSFDNLQTLCKSCNSSKRNSTIDYSGSIHDSSMSHEQAVDIARCPTDSLIPESLIPESLNLNPEEKHTAQKTRLVDVSEIFEFWKSTMGHDRAKLDDKRSRLIANALKIGYSSEDLKNAIVGCTLSAYHMGDNEKGVKYNSLTLIFRDAGKIDQFIGYFNSPPVKQQQKPAYQNPRDVRDSAFLTAIGMSSSAPLQQEKLISGEVV